MLAFRTTSGVPVALEPDFIESVQGVAGDNSICIVRTSSGIAHEIDRSYTYVTGVLRTHFSPNPAESSTFNNFTRSQA